MNEQDLRFTKTHEWLEPEGEVRRCGISDHAQRMLGDIVFVELPEAGQRFKQGDEMIVVESPKAAADVYAPVSGEIVEVNAALEGEPELVNRAPYGDGWLVRIKPDNPDDVAALMDADAYNKEVEE